MNRNISEDDKMKSNYAEYIVKKKADGSVVAKRFAIILCAVVLFGAGVALFLGKIKMPVAIVPLALAVGVLTWFLWRFTSIEYEYIVIGGTVEFSKIFGERQRKLIEEVKINDFDKVAPYENCKSDADSIANKSYYCISPKSENLYCIVTSADGNKRVIFFNATKKSLDAIRYYKASVVDYGNLK